MQGQYTAEQWRPVSGWETYEVSNLGRVRRGGRILKYRYANGGYPRVLLCRSGERRETLIHRLVADAFIGPCPPGQQVNHKDMNRANPVVTNLEYVTPSQNQHHANRIKPHRAAYGERHGNARLTAEQVRAIRASDEPGVVLKRRYGVADSCISKIRRRLAWTHIED